MDGKLIHSLSEDFSGEHSQKPVFHLSWSHWQLMEEMVRDLMVFIFSFFKWRSICWNATCVDTHSEIQVNS